MIDASRIVSADLRPWLPEGTAADAAAWMRNHGICAVWATFADGTERELFRFYTDELSFTPDEFVGLTASEARRLGHERDVAYLRSAD